jgi:hypothetical protein
MRKKYDILKDLKKNEFLIALKITENTVITYFQ